MDDRNVQCPLWHPLVKDCFPQLCLLVTVSAGFSERLQVKQTVQSAPVAAKLARAANLVKWLDKWQSLYLHLIITVLKVEPRKCCKIYFWWEAFYLLIQWVSTWECKERSGNTWQQSFPNAPCQLHLQLFHSHAYFSRFCIFGNIW